MAFHVACPITCRKICFCTLGFPRKLQSEKGKSEFLEEVARVEQFLNDPWLVKAKENATIQVKVPKVVVSPAPPPLLSAVAVRSGDGKGMGEEAGALAPGSAQVKRVVLRKQAVVASMVVEDYARRVESGGVMAAVDDTAGDELGHSNAKIMCRLCFGSENEGSQRASKMLSCNSCDKKYHRSCVKSWSQNRDLFHWSSWTCPSCRMCEVCRRTGDPNKFMFCKRCDGAYHCYCQQPPHKNVGHGPYLCPKHTKCHSCGSSVPGNGLSVRWFLGYTCCDACGRLFVKGNYCPVCLKVYRDSESTPMVCCDICQKWVHCPCDGISDAKYMQFQVDGNLQYVCPTCRGECYQIRSLEEAVQELWKRRDEADKDLIASLRAAAGLPTHEEIFDISPFSDDEESGPLLKNDYGRSLKFSLKGVGEDSPKKSKEHGKRSSKKKYGKKRGNEESWVIGAHQNSGHSNSQFFGHNSGDAKNEEMQFDREPEAFSPIAGSLTPADEPEISKHKSISEFTSGNMNRASRTIKIKSSKPHDTSNKLDMTNNFDMSKTAKGPKLVIHLGGRSRNITSPTSEAPSSKTDEDLASSNGHRTDQADVVKDSKLKGKEGPSIKITNVKSEVSKMSSKHADGHESISPVGSGTLLGKRSFESQTSGGSEMPASRRSKYSLLKDVEDPPNASGDLFDDNSNVPSISESLPQDRKPHMKFKLSKNSNSGNQNPLSLPGVDELAYVKGQRSKRRRPAPMSTEGDGGSSQVHEDAMMNEIMDANWILQKLGKDAAGKRVEMYQSSSNSWHRGTVVEVSEGIVSIAFDDGTSNNFELGKQGIRFVSQKQKR